MNSTGLIGLRSIVQDLVHEGLKGGNQGRSVAFYACLAERQSPSRSLFYRDALEEAKRFLKAIEDGDMPYSDSVAVGALLALRLTQTERAPVTEEINEYLAKRLLAREYSPLENGMILFLLCQGWDYLDSRIRHALRKRIDTLKSTEQSFENTCLLYASLLTLTVHPNNGASGEEVVQRVLAHNPGSMGLSQLIYGLWFYETFVSCSLGQLGRSSRSRVEEWNDSLKTVAVPRLISELMSGRRSIEVDEELSREALPVSNFELALVYETIMKSENEFSIISRQDFANKVLERSGAVLITASRWQAFFFVALSLAFFFLPWRFFGTPGPGLLVTALMGIVASVFALFLRHRHIKQLVRRRAEWLKDDIKDVVSAFLTASVLAYAVLLADVAKPFLSGLERIIAGTAAGLLGLLLPLTVPFLRRLLKDLLFPKELPLNLMRVLTDKDN